MIVEKAREYIGIPYLHRGRSAQGMDCAGLLISVGRSLEIIPNSYDFLNYGEQFDSSDFIKEFNKLGTRIYIRSEWKEGDILIFKQGSNPNHCGFYSLPNGVQSIVHASNRPNINKVIEHYLTPTLKSQIAGAFRFKWQF